MSNLDIKFKRLTPFKRCVLQNFPFIEADFDALTNYGLLCKIVEYLNQVIASQNEVQGVTEEIVNAFNNLYDYVLNYFANLDIQEEINKKLDAMVEDGTFEEIVGQYMQNVYTKEEVDNLPLQTISWKNVGTIKNSIEDLESGVEHAYLQGFCIAEGNIVAAFRNNSNQDDIVRLVEYNLETGVKIRQSYLELAHANSLSYREDTGKIYVAACTRVSSGETIPDNRIFVVDYETFTITQTYNILNIPEGHRIRSVWYDNEESKLYAGDVTDMYVIDETLQTITETIELETKYLNLDATNQTLKKIGDYYYGVWISYISVWDKNRKLIRLIPIDPIEAHMPLGECEDIAFDSEGNIILGSVYRPSPRNPEYYATFLKSNLSKNGYNLLEEDVFYSATTPLNIYVDASSTKITEDGSSKYPFKELQDACLFASRSIRNCTINVAAGTYKYTYINGCKKLSIGINGNVTINGLEIQKSDAVIWNENNSVLTIAGVSSLCSDVTFQFTGSGDKLIINKNTKSGTNGYGNCIWARFGHFYIQNATVNGDDSNDLANFSQNVIASLVGVYFNDYDGHYAITGVNNAVIFTYSATFNKETSATEHNVHLMQGSRFFHRNGNRDINDFVVESQSMIYPSIVKMAADDVYFGEVCTVDTHYNALMIQIKFPGASDQVKNVIIDIEDLYSNSYRCAIDTTWITPYTTKNSVLSLHIDSNDKLKITLNRSVVRQHSDGTAVYTNFDGTTEPSSDIACISKVAYCNL